MRFRRSCFDFLVLPTALTGSIGAGLSDSVDASVCVVYSRVCGVCMSLVVASMKLMVVSMRLMVV